MPSPDGTESDGRDGAFSRFFRRQPKQSRSRALVDAVIIALEDQLARAGEAGDWTLEGLVERAGVGIGSFYEYFADKESLLGALIGRLTERNFRTLIARMDAGSFDSLEETVEHMAHATAETYLARPKMMRVVMATIGRLGLMGPVAHERDRFAKELAVRARRFLPHATEASLDRSMQIVADGVMGVVAGELTRSATPDVARCERELTELALGLLRTRHPAPTL